MDTIRVMRIIEYTGPRDRIERQIEKSLHGTVTFGQVTLRLTTIGTEPEILEESFNTEKRFLEGSYNNQFAARKPPQK